MKSKITIRLNRDSIDRAIKFLNSKKKQIQDVVVPEYLQYAADWIINRANELLDRSDIGDNIKSSIFNSWDTTFVSKNHLKILNNSWEAAYVEFGIGIIGEGKQHPNANKANWEYNVPTDAKDDEGGWTFDVKDMANLDIPTSAIIDQELIGDRMYIYTKGNQGVWFLFNAVEDFKQRKAKQLWEQILNKYWSK